MDLYTNNQERFQSTLSVRRATRSIHSKQGFSYTFQSTLSVRRATGDHRDGHHHSGISIHALRKESDPAEQPADLTGT